MIFSAVRKRDNQVLYFYDLDSYNDYIDTYEEDLSNVSILLEAPFGAEVIDMNLARNEVRQAFNMYGFDIDKNTMKELYNYESDIDPNERIREMRQLNKQTFDINDNEELNASDDNPQEIQMRQGKLTVCNLFKAFYEALEDNRKQLVRDVFIQHKLDIDNLDTYIDQEINMNIDIYLNKYDTNSQFKQAEKEYKQSGAYKVHKNFMDAIDKSYDVVRLADDKEDAEKAQKEYKEE